MVSWDMIGMDVYVCVRVSVLLMYGRTMRKEFMMEQKGGYLNIFTRRCTLHV